MKQVKMIPVEKRKIGKIYVNTDDLGYPLTYSVLHKLQNNIVLKFEANTRKELDCFCEKRVKRILK